MTAKALPWRDEYLAEHFLRINAFLQRYQTLWRPQAFLHSQLPWEQQFPELASMLRSLSFERAEQLAEDDRLLALYLNDFVPEANAIFFNCELPQLSTINKLPVLTEAHAVPGRKWQQIQAFAACVPADIEFRSKAPLLEWCAGKAHLGRLLAKTQQRSVVALEWNADLVNEGIALAQRENIQLHFHCVDVLSPNSTMLIQREHDVLALHACGQLHLQLLHACVSRQPQALTLAPCCYHLINAEHYEALSDLGRTAKLSLSRGDLHTAVRDSVTSPQRIQRQRKTLQAWRLGFDIWQRETRGSDTYLKTPSQPLSMLKNGFPVFCRALSKLNGLAEPAADRYEFYEREGWRRLREVAILDLPRMLFRRPLELWLALDRALYLRKHNYHVEVGIFCERALTPRNIVLQAHRMS